MTKEFKFFPREKDRKPENINGPVETKDVEKSNDVENTKDVEKSKKNDNNKKKNLIPKMVGWINNIKKLFQ